MGCHKLTYYEGERALEVNPIFLDKGLEKKRYAEKNRVRCYRYGFNGQEKDDEWKGSGNSIAYEARIYDPRLGKMLSVDPWTSKYAWQTPYAYHANSPIESVDWKGYGDGDPEVGGTLNLRLSFGSGSKASFNMSFTGSVQLSTPFVGSDLNGSFKLDGTANLYNGGVGTSTTDGLNKLQFDLTLAGSFTLGYKSGTPMPQYTLNYNSKSAINNTNEGSLTWGQMLTFNSAIGKSYRQGMFGFKAGNFSMSSNNDDVGPPYFGANTDEGWTGGLIFSASIGGNLFEGGYQSFTGANTRGIMEGDTKYRYQSQYQRSLNKASTFGRVSATGVTFLNNYQLDVYTGGWFQDLIHDLPGFSGEHLHYDFTKKVDAGASTGL